MLSLTAFIVAIGVLVVVHELGHYAMAVACGVKVLRFSVGFGPSLWTWTSPASGTQFTVAALPLGGYVKMLDERDGEVAADQLKYAFNEQSLWRRVAIVAAGPLANLGLAVVLYAALNWIGVEQPQAILSRPVEGSVFATAGFEGGERLTRMAFEDDDLQDVGSFDEVRWWLTRAALEQRDLLVEYVPPQGRAVRLTRVQIAGLEVDGNSPQLFQKIGILGPLTLPRIGEVMADGAAERAGLRAGDLVLRIDARPVVDASQLRVLIRAFTAAQAADHQIWEVRRNGQLQTLKVTPKLESEQGQRVGRIGAYIGAPPEMVLVRHGPIEGLIRAVGQTWEMSVLTVKMTVKMVLGEASLKNLSGPITIADYAGKSAAIGLTQYVSFLALISISLGILNLLPLPILDGGHLMYYLWEALTGKPVSDPWMERLQRVGLVVLLLLMSVAVFNDVARLMG
ncbi:MAG: RIP metalloprotease RseP [Rhodoferax sp.]|nr:RIP metalloprotease RseP [Rhodoferax sp.]